MNAKTASQGNKWWVMLAGGVLLVGVGVYAGRTVGSPTPANTAASDMAASKVADKNTVDHRRLAALEQQVRTLRAEAMQQRSQLNSAETLRELGARESADATQPVDPQEAARRAEAARSKFVDGLAERVNTEVVDPVWRNATEPVIEQLLPERMGAGITVDEVRCASSICKARIVHSESARIHPDKLTAFLDKRGALSNMELQFDTREDGVTTLYLLRSREPSSEL